MDERREYQLTHPVGALRLADGRIMIADATPGELRYYGADGQHLRTAGGDGSGPGEFRRLRSVARMAGDTVAAWDVSARRLSFFEPDGSLASTLTLTAWAQISEGIRNLNPRHTLTADVRHGHGDRILMQLALTPDASQPMPTQIIQDTAPLIALHRSGEDWSEIGMFPGTEFFVHGGSTRTRPFGAQLRVAGGGDLIFAGSTQDTQIRVISLSTGEAAGAIDLPGGRRAPSAEDIAVERGRVVDVMGPDLRPRMAEWFDALPMPATLPVFSNLRVDSDGRLWVQLYQAPTDTSQEWLAFEASGNLAASVSLDTAAQVLDIGEEYALLLVTDEFGVQEVRMHGLEAR